MIKKLMLPLSDPSAEDCKKRVVIWRSEYGTSREEQGDHVFVMWGNHRRYDFSDKGAESPFEPEVDANGDETGNVVRKKGLFVFSVNLFDHSGLSFSLGGDPANGADPGGWDTTPGAAFLYVDHDRFVKFQGKDRWMKVPSDPKDWGKPWRDAASASEFREKTLRPIAQGEVDEMNLIADGSVFGYTVETKVEWTKTYESGEVVKGCDWEGGDSCGGYLTEHADDIDFPRDPDIPVFYHDDVYFCKDTDNNLQSFEYAIPEFVVREKRVNPIDQNKPYTYYAGFDDMGIPSWSDDIAHAKVYYSHWSAARMAEELIPKEKLSRDNIVKKEDAQ